MIDVAFPNILPYFSISSAVFFVLMVGVLTLRSSSISSILFIFLTIAELFWVGSSSIRPVAEDMMLTSENKLPLLQTLEKGNGRIFLPDFDLSAAALFKIGLRSVDGYDPFPLSYYKDLINRAIGCDFDGYSVTIPSRKANTLAKDQCPSLNTKEGLLSLLNIDYVILREPGIPSLDPIANSDGVWVYQLRQTPREIFGVSQVTFSSPETCLDELEHIDTRAEAILEEPLLLQNSKIQLIIRQTKSFPNQADYQVEIDHPGLLIRSETWAPGWQATVDGVSTKIFRVDCAFQGISLEKGLHSVQFIYAPFGFRLGRWITLFSLVLVIVVVIFYWVFHQKRIRGSRIR